MQSAGEPGLRPWHDLFMLCRRGSERVGVSDQGLPYIVADPRPRVNAQPNPGRATPYQHLLQQIKRASHDVAALMVERDVGPDEKTASSLSLPTVKTCLQHIEFWSGQSLDRIGRRCRVSMSTHASRLSAARSLRGHLTGSRPWCRKR